MPRPRTASRALALLFAVSHLPVFSLASESLSTGPTLGVWDGSVACVAAEPARCDDPEAATANGQPPLFELVERETAQRFVLAPGNPKVGLFADPRVRAMALRVVGIRRADRSIDLVWVYEREGEELHDVHFRCDVCNITASAPGPCWCCREPFELRHPKAKDPHPLATLAGTPP